MKLSNSDKLILVMLADIQSKLGGDYDVDGEFIKQAIYSDNTWALPWEFTGIFIDEPDETPLEVTEVCDILDMWWIIESSYNELSQHDKDRITEEAEPFGTNVRFLGFDGNYESKHLSAASFLIKEMKRFEHFSNRDLNSHCPVLVGYRRMVNIFKPIRASLSDKDLTVDEIIQLLRAKAE